MRRVNRLRIDRLTPPPSVLQTADGQRIAARCHRAGTSLARAVGLLGTADLAADEAVWLAPCRSVHSLGLRVAIGCAFLDRDGLVLRVVDPLPPGRVAGAAGARAVVECRAGVLRGLAVGERLVLGAPSAMAARAHAGPEGGDSHARRTSCP